MSRTERWEDHPFEDVDGRNLCDVCDEYEGAAHHGPAPVKLSWRAIQEQNRACGLVPSVLVELKAQGRKL